MKRFKDVLVVVRRSARKVPALRPRNRRIALGSDVVDLEQLMIETRGSELEEIATAKGVDATVIVEVGVPFVKVIQRVNSDGHDLVITAPDGGLTHGLRRYP